MSRKANILEICSRGHDVDVGVVEYNYKKEDGKSARVQLEIDFVVNRGNQRYYIQSALSISNPEKRAQEISSLTRIPDSFRKIVVVGNKINPWKDENGISMPKSLDLSPKILCSLGEVIRH